MRNRKFGTMYNITPTQKEILTWLVQNARKGELDEMFYVRYAAPRGTRFTDSSKNRHYREDVKRVHLMALSSSGFLAVDERKIDNFGVYADESYTLTGKAYEAVDSNFAEPDTSFVKHFSQLPDIKNIDKELKSRCLPILGGGGTDPKLWDSAVRTAMVILEERLRDVGQVTNMTKIGRELVREVFRQNSPIASKLKSDSERSGYQDLFLGIIGTFRNPHAHHLIDPTPENGGVIIGFVNLLLSMLEDLR